MRKYSDFFKTLHDEQAPTGSLGRGTHYSILRAAVFSSFSGMPMNEARFADFAVIWDEDHDDRVIELIEKIYFAGLLPHFLMFGERKGVFTGLLANPVTDPILQTSLDRRLNDMARQLSSGDSWVAQALGLDYPQQHPIINDEARKVRLYLDNLKMLWELGSKDAHHQTLKAS